MGTYSDLLMAIQCMSDIAMRKIMRTKVKSNEILMKFMLISSLKITRRRAISIIFLLALSMTL
jgi:hypothetical protein